MKAILLTGATGFLGSNIAKKLIELDYQIIAYKRTESNTSRLKEYAKEIKWYSLEKDQIEAPFIEQHIEAVIHTATNYGRNGESLTDIIDANVNFPLKVFEKSVYHKTEVFINTDTALDKFTNSYSLSKKQFLEWIKYQSKNIKVVNLKLEHFYGPKDDSSKFITFVLNSCLDKNLNKLELTEGKQKRDFIFIDDVVSAYEMMLYNINSFSNFEEVEVGTGEPLTIQEVVKNIKRLTESKINLKFGAVHYRDNEMMLSRADISKLLALGWKTKYSFEQGIKEILANREEL
jgi:CDP-paratose synthetase